MTKNIIHGSGGGKGGGSNRVAVEDPNTLQSKSIVTIVDVLSEGEILGLYGYEEGIPEKGIYLNDTPLITESGTPTYDGVSTEIRYGAPDQDVITDIPVEAEIEVNTEVTHDYPKNSGEGSGAITRTITNPNVTAARVKIRVSGLTEQDKSNGDLHGYKVSIAIAVNGVTVVTNEIDGKTTSVYERAYKFPLTGDGPWNITVHRLSDDNDSANINNDTTWASYTEIVEAKMVYPDTALVMLRGDAATFGNSVPTRKYLVYGQKCQVPVNYDPTTREYTGLWNGTFKEAWTDNPAWVYYDILTNDRYGVGKEVNLTEDTKFDLYLIAQYCDQMVDDGFGGTEPRFTFNYHITSREEALDCLRAIASTFRGFAFWAAGSVFVRADMPTDPKRLVTASNVIDGEFHYASTAYSSRHSVAIVAWNDPDNLYEVAREVVEDPDLIEKYGWKPLEITAYGCTSRGQANRLGKWNLYTEQFENETVTYTCGEDHFDIIPGDIISIADPTYMNVRRGGRLRANSLSEVVLDSPIEIESGESYSIHITMPDYEIEQRTITNGVGEHSVLTLDESLSEIPLDNAEWIITSTDLAPRQFRVLNKTENSDDGTYSITALYYNPNKFAMVEEGLVFDPVPYLKPDKNKLKAPTNLSLVESTYWSNGLPRQRLTVSWTLSKDIMVNGYIVQIQPPAGTWNNIEVGLVPSLDINVVDEGLHVVRVKSFAADGRGSDWVYNDIIIGGKNIPPEEPTNLVATGGFQVIEISWNNPPDTDLNYIEVWESGDDNLQNAYKAAEVDGTSLTRSNLPNLTTYWYWVRAVDISGNFSDVVGPVSATTETIKAPDIPEGLIDPPMLSGVLREPIERIPDIEVDIGGINVEVGNIRDITIPEVNINIRDSIQRLSEKVNELDEGYVEQLRQAGSGAIRTLLQLRDINKTLTDAGITTDPESGQVQIWAVDQLRNEYNIRLSETEITVDALASSINSKATLSDVDARIAEAVFGDVGELLVSGLQAQITTVEESLNAVEGTLTEKASAVDVDEIGGRVTTAESRLNGLDADIALKASSEEVGALDSRVTSAESTIDGFTGAVTDQVVALSQDGGDLSNLSAEGVIRNVLNANEDRKNKNIQLALARQNLQAYTDQGIAAEAQQRLDLAAVVGDNHAELIEEKNVRSTQNESMANSISALITRTGDNESTIQEEREVRSNETSATGSAVSTLMSESDTNLGESMIKGILQLAKARALIKTERSTRTNEDEALATLITTLQAELGDTQAVIREEQTVRATADSANASEIQTVMAQLGDEVDNRKAAIQSETDARVDALGAVGDRIDTVQTKANNNESAIQTEAQARSNETGSMGSLMTTVIASSDESLAGATIKDLLNRHSDKKRSNSQMAVIQQNLKAEIDEGISSEAAKRETLASQIGGSLAVVDTQLNTLATQDKAMAESISRVQATANGNTSSVETVADAVANVDGLLKAQYVIKVDVNGKVAGIGLVTDGEASEFAINADRLLLVDPNGESDIPPFVVGTDPDTGVASLYLNGDLFAAGTITGEHINASSAISLAGGAIVLDGVNGVVRISDPDDLTQGDYLTASNGELSSYSYLGGSYRRMKSLRRLETGIAQNNTKTELPGYWPSAPKILCSPSEIPAYSPSFSAQVQTWQISATNINWSATTKKCSFVPLAKLVVAGGIVDLPGAEVHFPFGGSGEGADDIPYTKTISIAIPAGATQCDIGAYAFAQRIASQAGGTHNLTRLKVTIKITFNGNTTTLGVLSMPDSYKNIESSAGDNYLSVSGVISFTSASYTRTATISFLVESAQEGFYSHSNTLSYAEVTNGWFKVSGCKATLAPAEQVATGTVNYIAVGE